MDIMYNHPYYGEITGEECYKITHRVVTYFAKTAEYPDWVDWEDLRQEGALSVILNRPTKWHLINLIHSYHAQRRNYKIEVKLDNMDMLDWEMEKDAVRDVVECRRALRQVSGDVKRLLFDYYIKGMTEGELSKKYERSKNYIQGKVWVEINKLRFKLKSPLSRWQFGPVPKNVGFDKGRNKWYIWVEGRKSGRFNTIKEALYKLKNLST